MSQCVLLGQLWQLNMFKLKSQQISHPLTQNTIKAFKFRAQAIFSLLEKTPPPLVHKI
jgi:hypothetical protein